MPARSRSLERAPSAATNRLAAITLPSANLAKKKGCSEEIVLACLLHDAGVSLMRTEHGYWGAQLIEPYVSERVAFAVRYHQALRFYPDPDVGYEYPESYYQIFGIDYVPPPHIQKAYEYAQNHKWYMDARLVTMNDLYSFDPDDDGNDGRRPSFPLHTGLGPVSRRKYNSESQTREAADWEDDSRADATYEG